MVNYCCIPTCNRNSRNNKYLNFYSLPKEKHRQIQWLKLAARDDLLSKDMDKLRKTLRFCSRHFPPNTIVKRYLSPDALPSKHLPGSIDQHSIDIRPEKHDGIICDSCDYPIQGFRYKCVTCDNYDICQKCEMLETHPEHYMLRIPKSVKFQLVDDLVNKCRSLFLTEHILPECDTSSDDEPVTKYLRVYDSGLDLTENVKNDIRIEISRALKAVKKKRTATTHKRVKEKVSKKKTSIKRKASAANNEVQILEYKKVKVDELEMVPVEETNLAVTEVKPELVFADVNTLNCHQADLKPIVTDTSLVAAMPNTSMPVEAQPLLYVTLSNDLSQFMIELAPDNNASESGTMK